MAGWDIGDYDEEPSRPHHHRDDVNTWDILRGSLWIGFALLGLILGAHLLFFISEQLWGILHWVFPS